MPINPFRPASILSLLVTSALATSASAAPSFEILPGFNPPNPLDRRSEFQDVSGDGRVLVGWADLCTDAADPATCVRTAVRWEEGVLTSLGGATGFGRSRANAVNRDGSIVVGWSQDTAAAARPLSPLVWRGDALEVVGDPDTILTRVSDDGSVFAGRERAPGAPWHTIRTTEAGTERLDFDTIYDMSADGAVVLGVLPTNEVLAWEAGIYTPVRGFEPATGVQPRVMSGDASTVVGFAPPVDGSVIPSQRVRTDEVVILFPLAGHGIATVFGASHDGDVVVGDSGTDDCGGSPCPPRVATVWDADGMARSLADILADAGVAVVGWNPLVARWVSGDGFEVVGWAEHVETGEMAPYRARIGDPVVDEPDPEPEPEPALALTIDIRPRSHSNWIDVKGRWQRYVEVAVMGSDDVDVLALDVETLAFGPGGALPVPQRERRRDPTSRVRDINGDSYSDLILRYRTGNAGFEEGDTEGCIDGATDDGMPAHGCDAVRTERPRWMRFLDRHYEERKERWGRWHRHDRDDDDDTDDRSRRRWGHRGRH